MDSAQLACSWAQFQMKLFVRLSDWQSLDHMVRSSCKGIRESQFSGFSCGEVRTPKVAKSPNMGMMSRILGLTASHHHMVCCGHEGWRGQRGSIIFVEIKKNKQASNSQTPNPTIWEIKKCYLLETLSIYLQQV